MTTPSSPSSPSSYHHGDLRAALIEAGEMELEERGIENFSLRRVAKRAGVSHAAPAHHFGDVNGLLTALATYGFELFGRKIENDQRKEKDLSQLTAGALGYIDFALEHPALFALMFSSNRPDFENAALERASDRAFERFVRDVHSETSGRTGDAHLDVMARWAMVHGLADLLVTGRMRSLLKLSKSKRRTALIQILGSQ